MPPPKLILPRLLMVPVDSVTWAILAPLLPVIEILPAVNVPAPTAIALVELLLLLNETAPETTSEFVLLKVTPPALSLRVNDVIAFAGETPRVTV